MNALIALVLAVGITLTILGMISTEKPDHRRTLNRKNRRRSPDGSWYRSGKRGGVKNKLKGFYRKRRMNRHG